MELYNFNLLCEKEQAALLYKNGLYIGKSKRNGRTTVLYQLEGFYVEVCYRKYRSIVLYVKCLTSVEVLNPFLDDINIEELVRCVG